MADKTRKEWSWQEYIEDLYKKILPKVYSRLAKLEEKLEDAQNRISMVEGLLADTIKEISDSDEDWISIECASTDGTEISP